MARRFARRRKPLVQWLPVFGTGGSENSEAAIGIQSEIQLATSNDETRIDAVGLTFDYTDSAETAQAAGDDNRTLRDLVSGSAYRLRRIVGKIYASWYNNSGDGIANRPDVIDYAAGFIVVRTDDNGNPSTDFEEVHPLSQDSADDPWIWRRRWFLRTLAEGDTPGGVPAKTWGSGFPRSTAEYHSVADGPHIDQKTARVVGRQERLFFVQAARTVAAFPGSTAGFSAPGGLVTYLDYRLLGSLFSTTPGNRRNASR